MTIYAFMENSEIKAGAFLLYRIPGCGDVKYLCRCYLGGLFLCELLAPPYSAGCGSAGATVVVFEVTRGLLVGGLAPVVPSLGTDVLAQLTVHEKRVGIGAPRTAQVAFIHAFVADDAAVVEDVAVFLSVWCRGGGDVGVAFVLYGASLKPSY